MPLNWYERFQLQVKRKREQPNQQNEPTSKKIKEDENLVEEQRCFDWLPDELVQRIFTYLHWFEVVRVILVCSRWNMIGSDQNLWECFCKLRWGQMSTVEIYKDLVLGKTVLWKVSFMRKYIRERQALKKQQLEDTLARGFLEAEDYTICPYCSAKKVRVVNYQRNVRYMSVKECAACKRQLTFQSTADC
jgi:hypothetical protein